MIKLKNLLIEVVSKSEVTKLMLIKNPKTIQAEYIRVDGKKEKNKYKYPKEIFLISFPNKLVCTT